MSRPAQLPARSIREADAVFANSRYVAETVRETFGIEAGTSITGSTADSSSRVSKNVSARPSHGAVRRIFQAHKRVEVIIQQRSHPMYSFD